MRGMKPLLAITMGDPTGVGPETIARAWEHPAWQAHVRAVVIGHPAIMRRALRLVQSRAEVVELAAVQEADSSVACLPCLPCGDDRVVALPPGRIDPGGGEAAYRCVTTACALARAGHVDGLVTAPLHKAALAAAGHDYPGHTELLAAQCGVTDVAMMLYLGPGELVRGRAGLGVAHATLHCALRDVFAQLTPDRIVHTAQLAHVVMAAIGSRAEIAVAPRLGVCALNPHGGEETRFGDEEVRIIRPAVERARRAGLDVHGPFPADTLMARAAAGEFDGLVALYHDQGHIALKLLGMHRAVNITLGLPVVRTSVAHGTAHDLAWTGQARCDSMLAAIDVGAQLVARRHLLTWQAPTTG